MFVCDWVLGLWKIIFPSEIDGMHAPAYCRFGPFDCLIQRFYRCSEGWIPRLRICMSLLVLAKASNGVFRVARNCC